MSRKMTAQEKQATELVRRRMKESKSSELLGFDVESVHNGRAVFRLDVRPSHKSLDISVSMCKELRRGAQFFC